MNTEQQKLDDAAEVWAVVEVMGHSQYAGRVSQHTALGGAFIRVEVPAVGDVPAFEKLLSPASIFAITPCTKEWATEAARRFRSRPFTLLCLPPIGGSVQPTLLGRERPDGDHFDDDDFDDDESVPY